MTLWQLHWLPGKKVFLLLLHIFELLLGILIAGIIRGRRTIVPGGNDCIQAGDRVIILAENQRLSDLSDILR